MVSLAIAARVLTAVVAFAQVAVVAAQRPAIGARVEAREWSVDGARREPAQQTFSAPGAKFVSVHFSQFNLADGDVVELSDASGQVVASYAGLGRDGMGRQPDGFFSTRVFSDKVTVQFKPSPLGVVSGGDVGFKVDAILRNTPMAAVSSICNADNTLPSQCYANDTRVPDAVTKSRGVVRIFVTQSGEWCTGWLLGSEGHVLTNAHCIPTRAHAATSEFEFDAESPTCNNACRGVGACRGNTLVTSASLVAVEAERFDYALVKLNPNPGIDLAKFGYFKLRIAGGVENEQIYIPQHPGGKAKRIAVVVDDDSVAVAKIDKPSACGPHRVTYDADTEPGSSGSPVVAARDNLVIALHSCGSNTETCVNSGTDVRGLIYEFRRLGVVPKDSIDNPSVELPEGPWVPQPTSAPTPPPPEDYCKKWGSESFCNILSGGKCVWKNSKCIPTTNPPPVPTTPGPTTPTPTTPAPTTPAPTTPAPTAPTPTTPAPTTPRPTTPAPTTPAPTTPAPTTPAPTTPAPTTPAPTTPAPTTSAPTTAPPQPRCATSSGGWCGNNDQGPSCCPDGEYCQPWNPSFYQCRPSPKQCGAMEVGVDYYGEDIKMVQDVFAWDCCDLCAATPGCKAFTFINYNADGKSACYLKRGNGDKRRLVGAVSSTLIPPTCATGSGGWCGNANEGSKCCPEGEYCQPWNPGFYQCRPAPQQCGAMEVGVDYYGEDIKTIRGGFAWDCCDRCADTAGCTAFTFVNYNADGQSACYLKRGNGDKRRLVGAVSAVVKSPLPKCSTLSNTDFQGEDLRRVTASSAADCCDQCAATWGCRAFTFVDNAWDPQACYLKKAASRHNRYDGAISGTVN
ncbi:hypothetical protein PINS_up003222 [Pythium insidiosum]|nr:hypothetical protein PINS_up003222 [Pythium insidiosum]